jgi:hypothetical protein
MPYAASCQLPLELTLCKPSSLLCQVEKVLQKLEGTTDCLAFCLLLAAAAHNRLGSVYGRRATPVHKAMNIFNALGSIAFAYNFTGGAACAVAWTFHAIVAHALKCSLQCRTTASQP